MSQKRYPETVKLTMVQKLLGPNRYRATRLSEEVGIPHQTLSRWVKEYGNLEAMDRKNNGSIEWSAEERFEALLETRGMSEAELGEYLRRKGLHSSDLERWREEMLSGLTPRGRGRPKKNPEVFELRKANKELQRELRRKEKALAEASALLVLKKKAELIWGGKEDEELD